MDGQKKFRLLAITVVVVVIIVVAPYLYYEISLKSNHGSTFPPSGIVKYFSVTLHNPSSMASPSPNVISLSVNSSSYEKHEAATLQNVEFFSSDGKVLSSFLVTGNSNTSNSMIYLVSAPFMAAGGTVTMYIGFANLTRNLLSSTGPVSEAP